MYEPKEEEFEFETVQIDQSGQIIKRECKTARQKIFAIGGDVTLEMVYIPGGTFLMGSPETEAGRYNSESPQHSVMIPPFYMGKYEVTNAQYRRFKADHDSKDYYGKSLNGDNQPAVYVSWNEARAFAEWMTQNSHGQGTFRLPSEAEWEYACRAGTTTPFYFGETITPELANYDGNYVYGDAPKGVYRQQTTDVGQFLPNAFGLYDMHGNVWEWCADTWHENYTGAPDDGSVWEDLGEEQAKLLHGGSWSSNPTNIRCAYRYGTGPDFRYFDFGLRVASSSRTL